MRNNLVENERRDKERNWIVRGVAEVGEILRAHDTLEELGNDTQVSTPSEFRTRVEQDMARWRPLAHVVNQS